MSQLESDLRLEWIPHGGVDYRHWLELRFRVLREPLGLNISESDIAVEKDDYHLVAKTSHSENTIVGGLILQTRDQPVGVGKMRQVAVEPDFQELGIGKCLVLEMERRACEELNLTRIVLHSRETVVPFYEKLGYETHGKLVRGSGTASCFDDKANVANFPILSKTMNPKK